MNRNFSSGVPHRTSMAARSAVGGEEAYTRHVPCERCPLRARPAFRSFTPEELRFVAQFKRGDAVVKAGATVLLEGAAHEHFYTVLSGWGFRYKSLPDGRRQILNFALAGDLLGLQSAVLDKMQHSVEALSDMLLCVFPREKLWTLYVDQPNLAFDVTWLAAREEHVLGEHLLTVGRRSAMERMAYLLLHLFRRAERAGITSGRSVHLPLTQQHVADTLGMSLVHTNKTLRRLTAAGMVSWKGRKLEIIQREALQKIAHGSEVEARQRPFL